MKELIVGLSITVDTALSIGAGGSAGTLADKSIVRDGWGRPIIPGSQVKGKLRWAVEQILRTMKHDIPAPFDKDIENQTLVRDIFGSPEHRSPLRFIDLPATLVVATNTDIMYQNLSQLRPSVSIHRRRGVAEDAHFLLQEVSLEGLEFAHQRAITGILDDTRASQCAALLWAAANMTQRWGGSKSRGLGWASSTVQFLLDGQVLHDDVLQDALRTALRKEGATS